jgi:hypothetical protein
MERKTPRQVLSQNLRALMQRHPELGTIKRIAEASNSTLSNGKVGRIYAASHTTDIDTLKDLAAVFDLEPWQLLVSDLNPDAPPVLVDHSYLEQLRRFALTEAKPGKPLQTIPLQAPARVKKKRA